MSNLTDIKYRMKGVSDTRQITSAMETISVAKMRKALDRYDSNKNYFEKILDTISDIVYHTNTINESYFAENDTTKKIFIVIASDKGLAGGFNHNILNFAWEKISTVKEDSIIFAVGQLSREFFEKKGLTVDVEFSGAVYEPSISDAKEISTSVKLLYNQGLVNEIYICYTKLMAGSLMQPDIIQLLPLSKNSIKKRDVPLGEQFILEEIEYEPSAEAVLDSLVMQYLTGVVYGALVQSVASEHSSRRAAMNNASKNASKIMHDLNVQYNRARQEAVTNELSEIITSAMGVTK